MECVPVDRLVVDGDAAPPVRVPAPSRLAPSKNWTVPVAPEGETVAVSITLCPRVDGLLLDAIAVVEFALLMVCVSTVEVLPLKFVSPPYAAVIGGGPTARLAG